MLYGAQPPCTTSLILRDGFDQFANTEVLTSAKPTAGTPRSWHLDSLGDARGSVVASGLQNADPRHAVAPAAKPSGSTASDT